MMERENITAKQRLVRALDTFIMCLIILNIAAVILETVKSVQAAHAGLFRGFEVFSVAVFSIEYIIRLSLCTRDEKYGKYGPVLGRLRYIVSPMALVDLVAIVPFYLPMIVKVDLRIIRIIRLFRIMRIMKLSRYSDALGTLYRVWRSKREDLMITAFIVFVLIILSSSLMYLVESAVQPEVFSSIPASMWWGVTTLSSVGYGDMYPITPLGKFLGAIISLLGIGMFALPTGIIGSGFIEEIHRKDSEAKKCPHCGKVIE